MKIKQNEQNKKMTAWQSEAYTQLAAAVIIQAVKDARLLDDQGNEARNWLLTDGLDWLQMMGCELDLTEYRRFVIAGCPGKIPRQAKVNRVLDQEEDDSFFMRLDQLQLTGICQ